MDFILNAYALQDIGTRSTQEDYFFPPFIDPCHYDETTSDWSFYDGTPHTDDRLFIVCDGMGGHDRGEVASLTVIKAMSQSLTQSATSDGSFSDDQLQSAVDDALRALYSQDDPKEKRKMGTTMAMLCFHADGATVGHIGDSRVYQFRPAHDSRPAEVLFCTRDHTMVNDLVAKGQLTVQQAAISNKRHILSRSMTCEKSYHPEVEIDHITDIQPGDVFFLCSDGVLENMDDDKLLSLLCNPDQTDTDRVLQLLRECKENKDNHTAYIIEVKDVVKASSVVSSSEALPVGSVLKSRNYTYHIEKVLGKGAFGITYLVNTNVSIQGQLGTINTGVRIALKEFFMSDVMERRGNELICISKESSVKKCEEKFRREASKLAILSHPNIVKVLEVFEANSTIYYSMEYLPDGSLNDYVNKRGGLPEQEAISCIRKIGSALSCLHANKMLHLDVKPANVMRDSSHNTVKLIDFGLSKQYEENGEAITSSHLGSGTTGYAPLEQSDSTANLGFVPQMDVYALGATYYKLLTGLTPPSAISVLNNGVKTLSLVKKGVSQKSIDAIKAAMQPMVANRLKSVSEFLDMLPHMDDEAFISKNSHKLWRWSIVVAFFAVIVIGGCLWLVHSDMQKLYGSGETNTVDSSFYMPMVKVEGGTFEMGSTAWGAEKDERPVHEVTLSAFYIGKYEVTQSQWRQVMENRKAAKSKNGNCPIYDVTWDEVQLFITRLNAHTGRHFRLPTEAEWEYAARGGCKGKRYKYSGDAHADSVAWSINNSMGYMHPVGSLKPNSLGIYDMSGNVWEYCSDFYNNYINKAQTNPLGPVKGDYHVIRGGSWSSNLHSCRVTYRQDNSIMTKDDDIGFRLVEDARK